MEDGPEVRISQRPEAQSARLADLDSAQRAGAETIASLLVSAVENLGGGATIDRGAGQFGATRRNSQNVLLGGSPGTGKTTLLLSLAQVLNGSGSTPKSESAPQKLPEEMLRRLRRRLIWLDTLDMESLPASTNLMSAVLARVEAAVARWLPHLSYDASPALLSPSPGLHEASTELAKLQTSVALSLEGNLPVRAEHLDPDTYALEVRRSERERVDLPRQFASVLAALSDEIAALSGLDSPMFVLPVDDVDLNPPACLALLEMLRGLQSPHLFVIVLADPELLQIMMRLRYRGELTAVARGAALDEGERQRAVALAADAMQKYFPPEQRIVLGRVTVAEALHFRPLHHMGPELRSFLGVVQLPRDSVSLAESDVVTQREATIDGPSATFMMSELDDRLLEGFSWPSVLEASPRELSDAYLTAQSSSRRSADQLEWLPQLVADRPTAAASPPPRATQEPTVVCADCRDTWQEGPRQYRFRLRRLVGWQVRSGSPGYVLDPADARRYLGASELRGSVGADGERLTITVPALRTTEVRVGDASSATFDWPVLQHSRVWAWERMARLLESADDAWRGSDDGHFGSWSAVITALVAEVVTGRQSVGPVPKPPVAGNWDDLNERLAGLDRAHPLARRWLVEVAALCSPEMGMRNPKLLRLPRGWEMSLAEDIAARRTRRLKQLPPNFADPLYSWQRRPRRPRRPRKRG